MRRTARHISDTNPSLGHLGLLQGCLKPRRMNHLSDVLAVVVVAIVEESRDASLAAHKSRGRSRATPTRAGYYTGYIQCVSENASAPDCARRIRSLSAVSPLSRSVPSNPPIDFDRGANSRSVTSRCLRIKRYCPGQLDRTGIAPPSSATLDVQSGTWWKKCSVSNFCN